MHMYIYICACDYRWMILNYWIINIQCITQYVVGNRAATTDNRYFICCFTGTANLIQVAAVCPGYPNWFSSREALASHGSTMAPQNLPAQWWPLKRDQRLDHNLRVINIAAEYIYIVYHSSSSGSEVGPSNGPSNGLYIARFNLEGPKHNISCNLRLLWPHCSSSLCQGAKASRHCGFPTPAANVPWLSRISLWDDVMGKI